METGTNTGNTTAVIAPSFEKVYTIELIHARCLRLLRDEDGAWDLTQDVFVRAFASFDSYREGSPVAFLLTIAAVLALTSCANDGHSSSMTSAPSSTPAPTTPPSRRRWRATMAGPACCRRSTTLRL